MIACRSLAMRFAAACALAVGVSMSANAATIIVTTANDVVAAGDGCSLREALINANTNSRSGSIECAAGYPGLKANGKPADTILMLPATMDFSASVGGAAVGGFDVIDSVLVWGGGAQYSVLDGGHATRMFSVASGATLELQGMALYRGQATGQGGTIQVGAGARLLLTDVTISQSRVSSFAVGGKGGGIYLAPGSAAEIVRSSLHGNGASGVDGMGGAIFCEQCTLDVRATTIAANEATAFAGGVFVSPGSDAEFDFVTFGYNRAVSGSALYAAGNTDLFAVLSADNGNGVAGDDLRCAGGLVTASHSFVEFRSDCATMTGITSRQDVVGDLGDAVLQSLNIQRFDGQPNQVLYWNTQYRSLLKGMVPIADCSRDQFNRAPVADANCDMGANYDYVMAASPMMQSAVTGGRDAVFTVGTFVTPAVDTVVRFEATGGIGEACDLPPRDVLFPAGTYNTQVTIDPDQVFTRPAQGRMYRVCEMQARAIDTTVVPSVSGLDGYAGDRGVVGSSTGVLRLLVNTRVDSAGSLSSPMAGTFLDIGAVPVGAGGSGNIIFRPPQAGWKIVSAVIDPYSPDADRFSLPVALPLPLNELTGTALPVHCRGGQLGDFEAFLGVQVETDTGERLDLVYGLRCRAVHTLSMSLLPRFVTEGGEVRLALLLDSPSILQAPLAVDLTQIAGDAVAGEDFTSFTGASVVTFQPGEERKEIVVSTTADESVELDETVLVRLERPASPGVVIVGADTTELRIVNDDVSFLGIDLAPLSGVPARSPAGVRNPVTTVLRNSSHPDAGALSNVTVTISVDKPVWIYSFVARQCAAAVCDESTPVEGWIYAVCGIESSQRQASCSLGSPLAPGGQLEISAIVEMAEIKEAPTLDVHGSMRVTARANAGGRDVEQFVESPYTITGVKTGGGGMAPWSLLWVALGLALRGPRMRAGGGKVRRHGFGLYRLPAGARRRCAVPPYLTLLEKKK